ncbi:outer membrane protein assembly factor BamD [Tautonia sociabilis]|uniref:PepSY domain-containing protein n=1 Tax=Tautonia sociabilis TaxID=2080755 RepID=A0A432MF21_9BACT|nr:hypothetical protein [Tautonia sociabilis]RUL84369.1 hypothetical protein TsocGM_20365 [Tautonia sociabilis]
MRRIVPLVATLALVIGCGEGREEDETVVPIDQLPPAVLKAAQEKLPGVTFDSAWKEEEDGQVAYEVRGKAKDGKIRDAKVTPDGRVLEVD